MAEGSVLGSRGLSEGRTVNPLHMHHEVQVTKYMLYLSLTGVARDYYHRGGNGGPGGLIWGRVPRELPRVPLTRQSLWGQEAAL